MDVHRKHAVCFGFDFIFPLGPRENNPNHSTDDIVTCWSNAAGTTISVVWCSSFSPGGFLTMVAIIWTVLPVQPFIRRCKSRTGGYNTESHIVPGHVSASDNFRGTCHSRKNSTFVWPFFLFQHPNPWLATRFPKIVNSWKDEPDDSDSLMGQQPNLKTRQVILFTEKRL
jgi:hypothetical protein